METRASRWRRLGQPVEEMALPSEPEPADEDLLEDLFARCLEALESGGRAAADAICAEHPQHAAVLHQRLEWLAGQGLTRSTDDESVASIGPYRILEKLGSGERSAIVAERLRPAFGRRLAWLVRWV